MGYYLDPVYELQASGGVRTQVLVAYDLRDFNSGVSIELFDEPAQLARLRAACQRMRHEELDYALAGIGAGGRGRERAFRVLGL